MKKRRVFLSLLICLAAAFFACGIFAISNTKGKGQTVTAQAETAITQTIYWGLNDSTFTLSSSPLSGNVDSGSVAYTELFTGSSHSPWYSYRESITTVNIATKIAPLYTAQWFMQFKNLQDIQNFDNLDMSNVQSTERMFHSCAKLTTVDVSKWDTSSLEDIFLMFYKCTSLQSVDVSNWDTHNLTSMSSAFSGCSSLTSIDVSNWDTSKVMYMGELFYGCSSLETLDLSNFDTSSIGPIDDYTINDMLNELPALKKLKLSDKLAQTISSVTNAKYGVGIALPLYYQDGTVCNTTNKMAKGGGYFKTMHYHTYDTTPSSVDEASCSDTGTAYYDCQESFCTYVKEETIPANGQHSFTNYVSNNNATCTADGTKTATCDNCTATDTVTDTGSATGHSTTYNQANAPTCVTPGNVEYYYCSKCNKNFDDSVGTNELATIVDPATGVHSFTTYTSDGNATCFADGTKTATCDNCTATETITDTGTATGNHSFTNYVSNNDATCTEDGTKTAQCDTNGCTETNTLTDTGTMLPHSFTTYTSDGDAKCTEDGHETATCDHCTATDNRVAVGSALDHDFSITVSGTQPTCQHGGSATMKCSRCEETQVQDSADPVDHVYTNYVSDGNATCTADGTKTAHCDFECGATDTVTDVGSATGHSAGNAATCTTAQTCTVCGDELAAALGHDWATTWEKDTTNHWHECSRSDEINDEAAHTYEWKITKEATTDEEGLMENLCSVCGHKDGEQEIAKLVDPNGEIDLPVDINVEFKVTQSSTDNDYSDIENNLKRGYWAQLWYRNDDGTLGDEFTDKINCFLTLKIPTEIIEAIRGGDEINRDKIAEGLKVYFVNEAGAPVEVENFEIAMRDDDSWQIKFNYNEKFRAEVVFAADTVEQAPAEPKAGIPWWVWLIVGLVAVAIVGVVIIIIVVIKKKNGGDGGAVVTAYDDAELKAKLSAQDKKLDEIKEIVDGGFNDMVDGE